MKKQSQSKSNDSRLPFKKAKPSGVMIGAARELVRLQLAFKNKLHVSDDALDHLRNLPRNAGVILISNHADEMDPRICLELSRLSGKQFISMCNREAFNELSGIAGWALQHLGHFSVERGAHDSHAKQYAIEVVKDGKDILVIFPEGEIFYLNEEVQPFHSGAIEIGMQAVLQQRKIDSDWKAYIVPMAIKYHSRGSIKKALEQRIRKMELRLSVEPAEEDSFSDRLRRIQKFLLEKEDLDHNVRVDLEKDLVDQIVETERAILEQVKKRHGDTKTSPTQLIDQSWQLSASIRSEIQEKDIGDSAPQNDSSKKQELQEELDELKEVAQLSSWKPEYYEGNVSFDRLAEVVLKLERELYKVKRPRQLTRRDAFVNISQPIDVSSFINDYQRDPHAFRHSFTSELQAKIQVMVDELVDKCNRQ